MHLCPFTSTPTEVVYLTFALVSSPSEELVDAATQCLAHVPPSLLSKLTPETQRVLEELKAVAQQ